jgi:hypothetical protein
MNPSEREDPVTAEDAFDLSPPGLERDVRAGRDGCGAPDVSVRVARV